MALEAAKIFCSAQGNHLADCTEDTHTKLIIAWPIEDLPCTYLCAMDDEMWSKCANGKYAMTPLVLQWPWGRWDVTTETGQTRSSIQA